IIWACSFILLGRLDPQSFAFKAGPEAIAGRTLMSHEAFFVSFGTLSNIPFDEVSFASKPARMLAMTEAMLSMTYSTVLVAQLVAIYSGDEPAVPKSMKE